MVMRGKCTGATGLAWGGVGSILNNRYEYLVDACVKRSRDTSNIK